MPTLAYTGAQLEVDEARCERIMSYVARKRMWRLEFEDAMQELHIVLVKALNRFDPTNGASFYTYLQRSCEHRGDTLSYRVKRAVPQVSLGLLAEANQYDEVVLSEADRPSDVFFPSEGWETEVDLAIDIQPLSSVARRIVVLIANGETNASEWCRLLKVDYAAVRRAKNELRRHLRSKLPPSLV